MPELPDIVVYVKAVASRVVGSKLVCVRPSGPFVLRTAVPPIAEAEGRVVREVRRMGKRIVLGLDGGLYVVIHLMSAGRLRWTDGPGGKRAANLAAALVFESGTLWLTEAGSRKRASIHLVAGAESLAEMDPGGLEVLTADPDGFRAALARESHTLKRSLTDPRLFSGIGNAYSDEILHRARLSPLRLTGQLTAEEVERLFAATTGVLTEWTVRLQIEAGAGFPTKVTAFREEMAVHGRYGQPCPVCGSPVQRITYAQNECNYCAVCQTEGRLLADRALSRLLKGDRPRTLEELEERKAVSR